MKFSWMLQWVRFEGGVLPRALQEDPKVVSQAGIRAFFALADLWALRVDDQMALLGLRNQTTYFKWKRERTATLDFDRLERLSHLLAIHQAIRTLEPRRSAALRWVKRPSGHPSFGGRSALGVMLEGSVMDLLAVRLTLEAELDQRTPLPEALVELARLGDTDLQHLQALTKAFQRASPAAP